MNLNFVWGNTHIQTIKPGLISALVQLADQPIGHMVDCLLAVGGGSRPPRPLTHTNTVRTYSPA